MYPGVQERALSGTRHSLRVCGTPGYIDPACWRGGGYSQQSDIYSFGIVLLDLVTGVCGSDADHFEAVQEDIIVFHESWDTADAVPARESFLETAKGCIHIVARRRPLSHNVYAALADLSPA